MSRALILADPAEPAASERFSLPPAQGPETPIARHGSWGPLLLAAVPTMDMVVAQIQARLEVSLGAFTLAQVFHGLLLAVFLAVVLCRVGHWAWPARGAALAGVFFGACVVLSAAVRWLGATLPLEDLVSDLKILYWLAAWMVCMVVCRQAGDFRVILWGLALAGTYAAVSVLVVQALGVEDLSPYEGISASAGGLNTAKGLGGILAATSLVWIWLTRRRHALLGALGFVLCFVALVMTYQRAGLVAAGVAMLWLVAWRVRVPKHAAGGNWALRPICLAAVSAVLIVLMLGTSDLQLRWEDLADADKTGSSRLAFWQEALGIYARSDWVGKVVGIGHGGLLGNMEAFWGAEIHAHSDVLDALVMYGILGLLCWLVFNLALLGMILRVAQASRLCSSGTGQRPVLPIAAGVGVAIFLVMAVESVLTGQMFGPHVMSFYLLAISGICLQRRLQASGFRPREQQRRRALVLGTQSPKEHDGDYGD